MDWELFNHAAKCRCCFASFGNTARTKFKITRLVRRKFYELTKVELQSVESFSNMICESCNSNLINCYAFQKEMIVNQERLRKFQEEMNPIVALNKIDDEISEIENPLSLTKLKIEALDRIKEEPTEFKSQVDVLIHEEEVEQLSANELNFELKSEFVSPNVQQWISLETEPIAKKSWKNSQTHSASGSYDSNPAIVTEREQPQRIGKKLKIPLCCDLCGKEFQKKSKMKNHLVTHLFKELRTRISCSYCDISFLTKQSKVYHERSVHLGEKKEFTCHCGRVFAFQSSLYGHKQSAHSANTFACSECDKAYPTKLRLKQHNQTHHEPRKPCEICGKMVAGGTYYASHVRSHKKVHKCTFPGCEKVFSKSFNRRYHFEAAHQPKKQVSCSICSSTFTNEMKLKTHIIRQHQIEKVKCIFPNCEFSVNYKKNLREHYERHKEAEGEWKRKFQEHLDEVKFRRIKKPAQSVQ